MVHLFLMIVFVFLLYGLILLCTGFAMLTWYLVSKVMPYVAPYLNILFLLGSLSISFICWGLVYLWYGINRIFSYPTFEPAVGLSEGLKIEFFKFFVKSLVLLSRRWSMVISKLKGVIPKEITVKYFTNFSINFGISSVIFAITLWLYQLDISKHGLEEKHEGEKYELGIRDIPGHFFAFIQEHLKSIEDEDIDMMLKVRQFFRPDLERNFIGNNQPSKFVFLDIDDRTYKAWGEPLLTPRLCLKNLIEVSVQQQAKAVIVDVNLSLYEDPKHDEDPKHVMTAGEKELSDFLQRHKNKKECSNDSSQNNCPPIILARTFSNIEGEDVFHKPLKPNPFFFEAEEKKIDENSKNHYVSDASSAFIASHYLVRHWWLWQPMCTNNAAKEVIPSIQLLTATMICNNNSETGYKSLIDGLQKFKPDNCDNYQPSQAFQSLPICEKLEVSGGIHDVSQRIMYKLAWNQPHTGDNLVETRSPIKGIGGENILNVFSAQPFAEQNTHSAEKSTTGENCAGKKFAQQQNISQFAKGLKDSIVVIGGSYTEGHDIHETPIGKMPGGLVIINAINSISEYGEIRSSSDSKFLIALILVLLISWIFTKYERSFKALIWSGVFIILFLMPISFCLLFYFGWWLNVTLPILVLEFHHLGKEFFHSFFSPEVEKFSSNLTYEVGVVKNVASE